MKRKKKDRKNQDPFSRKGTTSVTGPMHTDDAKLLLTIEDQRHRLIFSLAMYMGLRAGEVATMKWSDFLHPNGHPKETIVKHQSKTGKNRTLYVNPDIQAAVKEFYKGQDLGNYMFYPLRRGDKKKPITTGGINKILKSEIDKLGINQDLNVSSHMLRKTFGATTFNYLVNNGHSQLASLEMVREIFGHSSITVTMRYIGLSTVVAKEANNAIDFLRK